MLIDRKTLLRVAIVTVALLFAFAPRAHAAVVGDTFGDNTYESTHASWDGANTHLNPLFDDFGINHVTGRSLITGDVTVGQNPSASDQLQFQRFHVTDQSHDFSISFLDSVAGYSNVFGYYTYAAGSDPLSASIDLHPLFNSSTDSFGTSASFTVPEDTIFGFYLDANGGRNSQGVFYSENFRNADNNFSKGLITDHFLMFETENGLALAVEDLKFNKNTGLLGDQDYNDFVAGFLTWSQPTNVIPEPASAMLLAAGAAMMFSRRKRKPAA